MRGLIAVFLLHVMLLAGCGDTAKNRDSGGQQPAASVQLMPNGAPDREALPSASEGRDRPRIEIAARGEKSAPPTPQPQEIVPLAAILAVAHKRVSGEVIDVDLDDDDGAFHYELKILTPEGRKIEMQIDARSGRILKLEED